MPRLEDIAPFIKQSAYFELLGMKFTEWTDGGAVLEMQVEPKHLNVQGTAHGGALASLLDAAGTLAALSRLFPQKAATTIEFKINFVSPVRLGLVVARAQLLHAGQRTAISEVKISDERGTLLATGIVTNAILAFEEFISRS